MAAIIKLDKTGGNKYKFRLDLEYKLYENLNCEIANRVGHQPLLCLFYNIFLLMYMYLYIYALIKWNKLYLKDVFPLIWNI